MFVRVVGCNRSHSSPAACAPGHAWPIPIGHPELLLQLPPISLPHQPHQCATHTCECHLLIVEVVQAQQLITEPLQCYHALCFARKEEQVQGGRRLGGNWQCGVRAHGASAWRGWCAGSAGVHYVLKDAAALALAHIICTWMLHMDAAAVHTGAT